MLAFRVPTPEQELCMKNFFPVAILFLGASSLLAQSSDDLVKAAREAFRQDRQTDQALKLVSKALEKNPRNIEALSLRAEIHESVGHFPQAAADWSKVIDINPDLAHAYQARGLVHFKMGKITESIADFDRFIERKPAAKVSHWQRGISYYYAGRFDDGRKQFEGYQKFDSNDVENAVWRFMCMVRQDGLDKARKAILKIGNDRRVPMRQVYDLYKGDLKAADVLSAANADNELFYAHLYVGIYHDLLGDKKKALEHLNKATEDYRIGHYMWDVARVHRDILAKELP
jgi:lipoprotein NlpI